MKVHMDRLVKHLKTQIKAAEQLKSDWVYITLPEAQKCLELAEAKDAILAEPVMSEIEGGGNTWFYVCGECHGTIGWHDKFCKHCGRRQDWCEMP